MRPRIALLTLLALAGCAQAPPRQAPALPRGDGAMLDRDATAAIVLGNTFQAMQRLAQAAPAEQAEIVADARSGYDRAPHGTAQLRYALLLATPGQVGRDASQADKLLRDLVAEPETLVPVERAVALIELAQLDRELGLEADDARLQAEADRNDRDRLTTAQRKLQAEMEENAKLRKQLEDAQAKLDAITNIERNLAERKPGSEVKPQ